MNHEEARELLKKYRMGQCSSEELEIINKWYESFDGEDEGELPDSSLQSVKLNMLDNINRQISLAETGTEKHQSNRNNKSKIKLYNNNYFIKIAAVVAIGVGFLFYNILEKKEILKNDATIAENSKTDNELPATIFLSDGTVVWLKGDSRLEYPDLFTGNAREVTLVGEAFFKVAKDESKPFIIHSNLLITRVLGTSFNIKAYENDDLSEVSVVTGKVAVSVKNKANEKEIVLKPNQKAIYTRKNNSLTQAKAKDTIVYETSEKRRLVFNETPLDDIIKVLNSTYRVSIKLADPGLKNCQITAELSDEPLDVSLLILTKAIGAEFIKTGKEYILTGKGCGKFN